MTGELKAANHGNVVGLLLMGDIRQLTGEVLAHMLKKMQPLTTLGIKTFEIMLFMLTRGLLYEVFSSHVAIINYFLHTHQ